MREVRQRQAASTPAVQAGSRSVQAASEPREAQPARDAYVPARPDVVESSVRNGAMAMGAADGTLSGLGFFARFSPKAGSLAARTASVARVTAKAAPILNLPVAAYDIHKAMVANADPRSTPEVRKSQVIMAGLSVTAAVTGLAAVLFPPAALPLVVTSVASGVGSIVADQWPNLRKLLDR